jgi:hypothetical protein
VSLADALTKMSRAQKIKDDPLYIFDQNGFFDSALELKKEIKLPSPFAESEEGHNLDGALTLYLALGGSGSGVQFHKHSDGWNIQIWGKKRWLLYPPNKMPPHTYPVNAVSIGSWIKTTMQDAEQNQQPMSCVVQPGELIYVPENWYHATLNIGESIGVAGQLKKPLTNVQLHWKEGNRKHKKFGAGVSSTLFTCNACAMCSAYNHLGLYNC